MSELRDLYAGLAMHALLCDKQTNIYWIADKAFEVADTMMEEREKRRTQETDAADGGVGG